MEVENERQYILMWIESFDGDGLVITDWNPIKQALFYTDFSQLRSMFERSMFEPRLYNSIQEYVDDKE